MGVPMGKVRVNEGNDLMGIWVKDKYKKIMPQWGYVLDNSKERTCFNGSIG